MQIVLNEYLGDATEAQIAFLAFAPRNVQEGFDVDIVGAALLPEAAQILSQEWSLFTSSSKDTLVDKEALSLSAQMELAGLLEREITNCLLVPVTRPDSGQLFLVAALINKREGPIFDLLDLQVVNQCFQYVLGTLVKAVELEEEKRLREQCQTLLKVAKNLFSHLDDVERLLIEIMTEARNLTRAECCSLFLLDKQRNCLVAKVFDGTTGNSHWNISGASIHDLSFPSNQGIAGHVAITGELLNIKDAYAHPLFHEGMDKNTGFKTRYFVHLNNDLIELLTSEKYRSMYMF